MMQPAHPETPAGLGILSGTVADPSGARINRAAVHVESSSQRRDATTDSTGTFNMPLPLGSYAVTVTATGFRTYTTNITLTERTPRANLNIRLQIAAVPETITVPSQDTGSTAAAENKSALVLNTDQLKEFSDDDSMFQQEILAMAGGESSKPPEILINGFSNGRFPPKNTIAQIRINQNPYSAQYDRLGFGRVEISTKPGTSTLHGEFDSSGTDNVFNARNPYATVEPPYYTLNLNGNVSGSFNSKTSFFVSGLLNDLQNNAIVVTIDPTLLTPVNEAVPAPQVTQNYSGRLDRQITPTNTFMGRYEYNEITFNNSGVGLLVLPSEGLDTTTTTNTLQLSDTQVIGAKIISDTHFQYIRTRLDQRPVSTAATIVVQGAFNAGGSPAQFQSDHQDDYEFQELLTVEHRTHFVRIGGRYRGLREANETLSGYNGQFTFPDLATYQLALEGETPAQIFASTGQTTQYNLTAGQANAVVFTSDVGVFAEDEWKVTKNLTLDYGFRYESQSGIADHVNPAPRVGFAWAPGKTAKHRAYFVLRGGGGIFYDRFASSNILTAVRRQSGTQQAAYFITNPDFYQQYLNTPPPVAALGPVPPTLYNIDPNLRTQYDIIGGATIERRIGKMGTASVNYIFWRTNHQYLSRNINAPLPGTYDPADPSSGVRPMGGDQNIYQFSSGGMALDNFINASTNLQVSKRVSLFATGYFALTQKNDAPCDTCFPSNQYDPHVDYAREANPNVQIFAGTTLKLPYGFTGSLWGSIQTGSPFNITTGTDLNGDTIYNDRPAFATNPTENSQIYKTRFGTFDANPQPGEPIIPFNYGDSPNFYFLLVHLERAFQIGPRPATTAPVPGTPAANGPTPKPDRPYTLTFGIEANNIFNHVNPGQPVGVLTSPLFGQSISLNSPFSLGGISTSSNRTVTLHCNFSF
ncbi:TonB-dependent receptor [Granulicella sp. L46]|uniref:TonB-dependent receptor n=1 Tax=Granulicella sp. L46 TaxID=1641865 RepID=UPI00131D4EDC|nr:carboxypeptidase regulatory-like domain-containing protein [Granulicella sp. L46]